MSNINNAEWIIKVENLNFFSGKNIILKNINLEIKKGEIFGLLGPNGSGKSTLLSIIASILKPSSGQVIIDKQDSSFGGSFNSHQMLETVTLRKKEPLRASSKRLQFQRPAVIHHFEDAVVLTARESDKNLKIGFVPQEIALYPMLSAFENLKFWASIYKLDQKKDRITNILSFLKLSDVTHTQVHKFSVGMQRRLNIGVALIHEPDIIIMDEPTVGIDISSKLIILEEITKLKNQGKTFIYTTHNADEPEKICDRIAVIRNGSIDSIGTLNDLIKKHNVNSVEELMS